MLRHLQRVRAASRGARLDRARRGLPFEHRAPYDHVAGSGDAAEAHLAFASCGAGSLVIDKLWNLVEHMATTLGHIDGEGHCHTES